MNAYICLEDPTIIRLSSNKRDNPIRNVTAKSYNVLSLRDAVHAQMRELVDDDNRMEK